MTKQEVLATLEKAWEYTKEFYVKHKNVSAFVGGFFAGFCIGMVL